MKANRRGHYSDRTNVLAIPVRSFWSVLRLKNGNRNELLIDHSVAKEAGLDTSAGLDICFGNVSLYQCLLLDFYSDYITFTTKFKTAQQALENDPDALIRCAHTLKGTAANICATRVSIAAEDLETACKSSEPLRDIETALHKTLAALKPVLILLSTLEEQLSSPHNGEYISIDALREQLKVLERLLADSNIDCVNLAISIAHQLTSSPYAMHARNIKSFTSSLEFTKALAATRELSALV